MNLMYLTYQAISHWMWIKRLFFSENATLIEHSKTVTNKNISKVELTIYIWITHESFFLCFIPADSRQYFIWHIIPETW